MSVVRWTSLSLMLTIFCAPACPRLKQLGIRITPNIGILISYTARLKIVTAQEFSRVCRRSCWREYIYDVMDKFSSEQVEYPEIEQVRDLNSIGTTATSSMRSDEAEASRNIFDNTRRSTVTHPGEYIQQHHGFTVLGLQDQQQRTAGSSYGVASTSTQRPQFSNLRSVDHDPAAARHEMNIPLFKLEESFELRSAARHPQHDTWTEHQSHHERQQQWEQDLSSQRIAATKQEIINDSTLALSGFTSFLNPIGAAQQQASSSAAQPAAASTSSGDDGDQHWAPNLLLECARAIATSDTPRVQNLMWVLNELASPYGDYDQRLASYFLQALFCRITNTGARCHSILSAAAEKTHTFESVRKMILTYQVLDPTESTPSPP